MRSGWEHRYAALDRLVARAIGLSVRPIRGQFYVYSFWSREAIAGPFMFRGTARHELERLGHQLRITGTVQPE